MRKGGVRMNYQAHRIGGVCTATIVSTLSYQSAAGEVVTYIAVGLAVVGGAIGGLLPDIDHPTSKIGKRLPPISKLVNSLFGHRGFTHSLLANLLFAYFLFLLTNLIPDMLIGFYLPFALGLIIGYASHLLLDVLTVSGIPLLYPFSKQNIRIAKLRSGKDDLLVSIILIGGTGLYLYFFLGI